MKPQSNSQSNHSNLNTQRSPNTQPEILIGTQMPSLKDICPRKDCRVHLTTAMMDSGVVLERCPEGHYEARTVTGESRLAWHEAVASGIRIGRGRLYR